MACRDFVKATSFTDPKRGWWVTRHKLSEDLRVEFIWPTVEQLKFQHLGRLRRWQRRTIFLRTEKWTDCYAYQLFEDLNFARRTILCCIWIWLQTAACSWWVLCFVSEMLRSWGTWQVRQFVSTFRSLNIPSWPQPLSRCLEHFAHFRHFPIGWMPWCAMQPSTFRMHTKRSGGWPILGETAPLGGLDMSLEQYFFLRNCSREPSSLVSFQATHGGCGLNSFVGWHWKKKYDPWKKKYVVAVVVVVVVVVLNFFSRAVIFFSRGWCGGKLQFFFPGVVFFFSRAYPFFVPFN